MELRQYRIPYDYWVATRVKRDINSNHTPKSTDSTELSSLKYSVDALSEEFESVSQIPCELKESLIIQRDPNGIGHRVNWRFGREPVGRTWSYPGRGFCSRNGCADAAAASATGWCVRPVARKRATAVGAWSAAVSDDAHSHHNLM